MLELKICALLTFDKKNYTINKTIEELEKIAGLDFLRANRQNLIHRKAIKEASQYFAPSLSVTLTIPFKETINCSCQSRLCQSHKYSKSSNSSFLG